MKYFIAGGAGFIGSNLARHFKRVDPQAEILVIDNLYRRGSDLNLPVLKSEGIHFEWCDVKDRHALSDVFSRFSLGDGKYSGAYVDVVIDCVAEPAVKAGTDGKDSTFYNLVDTNLNGTINLLRAVASEEERSCTRGLGLRAPMFIFLSTSRVYSIKYLNKDNSEVGRVTVPTLAPIDSPRSYYGTTKLAAELFVEEICTANEIPFLINRCGIIAGPGQFGKVDQGVVSLWVMAKRFGKTLSYNGFGGEGDQIRDALHVYDLCEAIELQISKYKKEGIKNRLVTLGGGYENSFTLKELTQKVHDVSFDGFPPSNEEKLPPTFVKIGNRHTDKFDVFSYITDNRWFMDIYGWEGPKRSLDDIIIDTQRWIIENESSLKDLI